MSELGIRNVKLAPDGASVTWLAAGSDGPRALDLWRLDVKTGKSRVLVRAADLVAARDERLTDEEKARRERQRLGDAYGILEYEWSPSGDALLFPLGGHLYLVRLDKEKPNLPTSTRLTATAGEVTDPRVSPRGTYASYVRDRHLWAVTLATGETWRVSGDLAPLQFAGAAEFIAQEEMHRFSGYWWAPDDSAVAYTLVDESPVAIIRRSEVYADRFDVIEQRYPYAGAANAVVSLLIQPAVAAAKAGLDHRREPIRAQLPEAEYLARVNWDLTGQRLYVQTQNREQTTLVLSAVAAADGTATTLLTETDAAWINLHDALQPLADGRFIWASERSGFRHLELRTAAGDLARTLTHGDWAVASVRGLDRERELVYFDGFADGATELHLYQTSYAAPVASGDAVPRAARRLTKEPGWHETTVGGKGKLWVDVYSTLSTPPRMRLFSGDGVELADLQPAGAAPLAPAPEAPLAQQPSGQAQRTARKVPGPGGQFGTLTGPDGSELHYLLRAPSDLTAGRRYPAVVYVYGGPGAQMVQDRWLPRVYELQNKLVAAGFVVLVVDNRGSTNRGKRFESVLKGRFGAAELADQRAAAEWLGAQDFVDPKRIGITGASYGGYMTLMAMCCAADLYSVGVSIAPVTDWHLYDTHYTERYLGDPRSAPVAYEQSAVLPYVAGLTGKLLMIHGMADDNVLYTHSTKLYKALQEAGKLFDIMVYPGEKHGITGAAARRHELATIVAYFTEHLGGKGRLPG